MKKIFLLSFFAISFHSSCESELIFVCPGLKIGYTFGNQGGFTLGYEVSIVIVSLTTDSRYGIVYDYDIFRDNAKYHIGLEYMYRVGGIDIGPTFFRSPSLNKTGFTVIPFGGMFVLPYYNFTYIDHQTMFHEVGTYGKIFIGDLSWFKLE